MKRSASVVAVLFFGAAFIGCTTGTQNTPNLTTSAANHQMSNMSGHDMSNMDNINGHDTSSMPMAPAEMRSAPDAASQPYDLQFIDSMIHHHEGGIQMAKMVLGKTERPELKGFAQKIIDDQTKEITQMKQWREQWYPGKPSALNMEMAGMQTEGMKMMTSEHMKTMDEMEPAHFDNHFLNMMSSHHEGAVIMAKEALTKVEHPELKKLAQHMIDAQQAEIKQMQQWKDTWKK